MKPSNAIRMSIVQPESTPHPPDFKDMEKNANDLRKQVDAIEVSDALKYRALAALLVTVKMLAKEVVAEFSPWVKKAHQAHKEVLAAQKKYAGPVIETEELAKQKLELYCIESGEVPECGDVVVKEHWAFEIVNGDKIPREFLIPDMKRIGKAVEALKREAAATIPGIKVFEGKTICVKGDAETE